MIGHVGSWLGRQQQWPFPTRVARGSVSAKSVALVCSVVLCATVSACGGVTSVSQSSAAGKLGGWKPRVIPVPGANLLSVSALPTDAWVVGSVLDGSSFTAATEHWSGGAWSAVNAPFDGTDPGLSAVTDVATNDAWAVGNGDARGGGTVVHWDGSQWRLVAPVVSSTGPAVVTLEGVAAWVHSDVWTVGNQQQLNDLTKISAIAAHLTGSSWQSPGLPPGTALLAAIAGASSTDVWAVGEDVSGEALVLHWNGQTWARSATPIVRGRLSAVTEISPTDVWAAGHSTASSSGDSPLVEHWDGATWSASELPSRSGVLAGISASSSHDVWAVGTADPGPAERPLIFHWNGTSWISQAIANVAGALNGVAATLNGFVFAAGSTAAQPRSGVILDSTAT